MSKSWPAATARPASRARRRSTRTGRSSTRPSSTRRGPEGTLRLRRELEFPNFRDAFGFVARLALLAEAEGHHPDIELGWGRVAVTLTTHAAGGLTDNDFILAAKLDRL